jgi:3-deoxy-7-phosphoheptulonate synthase
MGMTKMGVAAIFETRGNDDCHVILRGGKAPNYGAAEVAAACATLRAAGLREQVMIDFSHGNSAKDALRQIAVADDVAAQIAGGDERIVGVMIESHLEAGRQDLVPGVALKHGVSITDACIGFDQTEPVLVALAKAVRERPEAGRRALAAGGEAPAGLAGQRLQGGAVGGRHLVLGGRALAERTCGNSRSSGTSWARACPGLAVESAGSK